MKRKLLSLLALKSWIDFGIREYGQPPQVNPIDSFYKDQVIVELMECAKMVEVWVIFPHKEFVTTYSEEEPPMIDRPVEVGVVELVVANFDEATHDNVNKDELSENPEESELSSSSSSAVSWTNDSIIELLD